MIGVGCAVAAASQAVLELLCTWLDASHKECSHIIINSRLIIIAVLNSSFLIGPFHLHYLFERLQFVDFHMLQT